MFSNRAENKLASIKKMEWKKYRTIYQIIIEHFVD